MKSLQKYTRFLLVWAALILSGLVYSQDSVSVDSLKGVLNKTTSVPARIKVLKKISYYYALHGKLSRGIQYDFRALKMAEQAKFFLQAASIADSISILYRFNNQTDSAIIYARQAANYDSANHAEKDLLNVYKNLGKLYDHNKQYFSSLNYYNKAISLAQKLKDSVSLYAGLYYIGDIYEENDQFQLAIDDYAKARDTALKYKLYSGALKADVNIGGVHGEQGTYAPALQAFFAALNLNNEYLKKDRISAVIYVDLGAVYHGRQDTAKAMKYYNLALSMFKKLHNPQGVAITQGNIGNVYMEAGEPNKAETYLKQSLNGILRTHDTIQLANAYTNLGELYLKMNQYPKALTYYNDGLQIANNSDDWVSETNVLSGLSKLYFKMGNYKKAEEAGLGGFTMAKNINYIKEKEDLGQILSNIYEKTGRPAKALYYYKQYVAAKDTMDNKKILKKILQTELSYEYAQKQQSQKLEQEKKDALNAEKARHERMVRNVYLGGLLIVLLLTILLLKNFIRVRKANHIITEQKSEVEQQKSIVEQKNRDITDSINYAKRIQQAMLPTKQTWDNFFKQSFIYYMPKDIVSGDFYWCMAEGKDIIAVVADCTGHGVPGAFMSMLGIASLNKIVGEQGIKQPGKILDTLRDEIVKSLNPEGKMEEVKDGMDMTLCYISMERGTLEYAAANNPLWITRKSAEGWQLIELEADKMPVGKYLEEGRQFSSRKVEIKKGDRLYLFTDGCADQFGGEKGKKFKYRHLQDVLLSWQDKNMQQQKKLLEKTMQQWKGKLEQVDDMLVTGIEIM